MSDASEPGYEGHVVIVGIRNLDDREKQIVRASGVHVFTMNDILAELRKPGRDPRATFEPRWRAWAAALVGDNR